MNSSRSTRPFRRRRRDAWETICSNKIKEIPNHFSIPFFSYLSLSLSLSPFKVSWIRKKDYHLLTVGLTTYSSDERFSALHLDDSEVILILSLALPEAIK